MTKGTRLDEAQKEAIRADVILAKKNGRKMKEVAARHNIHPTMISRIMNDKGNRFEANET